MTKTKTNTWLDLCAAVGFDADAYFAEDDARVSALFDAAGDQVVPAADLFTNEDIVTLIKAVAVLANVGALNGSSDQGTLGNEVAIMLADQTIKYFAIALGHAKGLIPGA